MPMSRYQMRNEYSLADPELYKTADKDDPEALLEGVAMAGLVGVLRQLGDLAEFAAEIFHDLHEEVMVTAARGHTLMTRVQQLESEFPPIEKAFLSQTTYSTLSSNSGTEWHPNLQMNQNLITKGDLPRFVMDSYEEARSPPRLFLLDKFDIAGAGSCLKRYSDPSFYKVEASFLDMASVDVQRDKKLRKAKKKGPRWKHGETPEILPSTKLHQLFLEERVESGASDPARLVKLKRKSSASVFSSEHGKSYMEKFLKTPPEDKVVHEVLKLPSKSTTGSALGTQILEVSNAGADEEPVQGIRGPYPPPNLGRTIVVRPSENDIFEDIVEENTSGRSTSNPSFDDKDIAVDEEIKVEERESYHSDSDDASEIDSYMDALATIESEVETDTEFKPKKEDVGFLNIEKPRSDSYPNEEQLQSQSQSQYSDSQSIGNFTGSDDGNSSIRKGVSSFSCSDDTVSTSAEDTPSPENSEAEVTFMSSNQGSSIDKVRVDQLSEHEASDNARMDQAEIQVNKAPLHLPVDPEAIFVEDDKSGELELSNDASSDASEILDDPKKTDEQQIDDNDEILSGLTKTEKRRAEESGEISNGLLKIKEQTVDDNGENSGALTKMEEQDDVVERSDETTPRLSYEEHLEDESKREDSYVESCTVIENANILEEIYEKEGSEKSLEDVVQTNLLVDVLAGNSVDTQVMSPDSVISHPEELPTALHLEGLSGNANDDLSDKFDSAEIDFLNSEERNPDETRDGKLSRDSESDVEEGENECCVKLLESDFPSHVSESQDPPSLSDDISLLDEREDKIVHTEDEVEEARKSSLPEDHAQSDERENMIVKSQILEPESSRDFVLNEETCLSLSRDCTPVLTSLEENVEPEIDQLDLQPLNIPDIDFDSSELIIPTQPLDQEKTLHVEELDVGPLLAVKVSRESSQSNLVESNEIDRKSWPDPISGEASVKPQLNQDSAFPGFNLLPVVAQLNMEEMPPLPPLPPMQWRIGKPQYTSSVPSGRDNGQPDNHFPPIFPSIRDEILQASNPFLPLPPMDLANSRHEDLMSNMVNSTPFLLQMPTSTLGESQVDFVDLKETQSLNPFDAVSTTSNELAQNAREGEITQPTIDHRDGRIDFNDLSRTQSSNSFTTLPETCSEKASPDGEGGMIQLTDNSLTPAITLGPTSTCSSETPNEELTQSPHQLLEASLGEKEHDLSSLVSGKIVVGPPEDFVPHPPVENGQPGQPKHVEPTTEEETVFSSSTSQLPYVDDEKPNGINVPKLPRPRSPLIDAVAAHDKSKLRKVTERVRPQEEKVEEKDSILEQIRMKSFNLKPAVATRPTIQGPRTNLRVAAILEKANAIRQAFAGSDDDDDDSWSDS